MSDNPAYLSQIAQQQRDTLAAIETLRASLTEIQGGLTALRTELMARMDRQQDTISAIRDDIVVNMAAAGRAMNTNDATRRDVHSISEMLLAMQRQINRLNAAVFRGD